jgi:hypothetical protein|tara:strand:+ start:762 stop:1481 length:720 start_codon:yes stop_codon:yes gene_type:complete
MKIERKKLEEIIKEELSEVGLYHSPKTGRWTKKEAGAVKSLSKKGAKSGGVSQDLVGRGVVTSKDKVSAKMGMNFGKDECGRKSLQATGDNDITARFKCSDYKQPYAEGVDLDGRVSLRDVVEAAETSYNGLEEDLEGACAPLRSKWLKNLLRSLNSVALAQKGDLIPKVKEQKEDDEDTDERDDWEKSRDGKQRAKKKKLKATAGLYVPKGGFSKSERELLSTNSLWERFVAENSKEN